MNHTVADGFAKSTATPITAGISDAKTRTGSTGAQSFAMVSNHTTLTATNAASTEIMNNLNPVTKKYLQQIEKAYTKGGTKIKEEPSREEASSVLGRESFGSRNVVLTSQTSTD